ncbi:DinB family protein [Thalassobacillus sp. CUG 92003]|uniref:DinB family protein n=1 Tax=Thalassobacillus sp. CUG 92003 TaxID=2736641 RepID=UPI0015E6467A|nr:DinB family protein [Thalassobacillus sp. CUG 92003]
MYGLDEKRQELLDFVEELTNEEARIKPEENAWSILEVLEHLYLMEQLIVHQMSQAIKQGDKKNATSKPIHRATNRDYKVEAPGAVQPRGAFQALEDAKQGLKKSREATYFLIHNKDQDILQNRTVPHPAFGEMDLEQWTEFIGWHELRHLDQIKEIKANVS